MGGGGGGGIYQENSFVNNIQEGNMTIIFGNTLSLYDYFGKYVSEDVDVLSANVTEQQMPFK